MWTFLRRQNRAQTPEQIRQTVSFWVALVQPLERWPLALRASLERVPTPRFSVQALRRLQGNGLEWRYLVRRLPWPLRKVLYARALPLGSWRLDLVRNRQCLGCVSLRPFLGLR